GRRIIALAYHRQKRRIDLVDADLVEAAVCGAESMEETPGSPAAPVDGPRRQVSFQTQVIGEGGDLRGRRAWLGGRGLPAAQELEPLGDMAEETLPSQLRVARLGSPAGALRPAGGLLVDLGSADNLVGSLGQAQGVRGRENMPGELLQEPVRHSLIGEVRQEG